MNGEYDKIIKHLTGDSKKIQDIQKNMNGMFLNLQNIGRQSKQAIDVVTESNKTLIDLVYRMKSSEEKIADNRHAVDGLRRELVRVPELIHKEVQSELLLREKEERKKNFLPLWTRIGIAIGGVTGIGSLIIAIAHIMQGKP
jgi:hypothetical protein